MVKNNHTAFKSLPIVDISPLFSDHKDARQTTAKQLDKAARETGFLYLKGHQIPPDLIDKLKSVVKKYFSQDVDKKMQHYIGLSQNHTGYVPQGEEQFYSELKSNSEPDLKEGYDIGPESPSLMQPFVHKAKTIWPDIPEFKHIVTEYYQAMLELSRLLFKGFALALGLDENIFSDQLKQPPSQLRLLHYFDNPNATENDSGISAHTDYEFFTILLPTSPGLQVLNGVGEWIDVPIIDGCFVMNIGDMMELITNGEYVATAHRVLKVKQERYSFPFFSSLDYDTIVKPISLFVTDGQQSSYEPIVCGDHLLAQTIQTFDYLKKRKASGEIHLPEKSKGLMSFGQFAK